MKRLAALFAFALFLLLPTSVAAADCQFVLGFATLRDLIGHDIIGECGENEHYNSIGDSVQQTTGGLLVWRKVDNWTAFTDGYRTWINGPNGLEQRHHNERFEWELDYAPGGLSIGCRDDRIASFTQVAPRTSPPAASQASLTAPSLTELAMASGWYRDGLEYGSNSSERRALRMLAKIDSNNPYLVEEMSSWAWLFDDDMIRHESHVIEFFSRLDEWLPAFVPSMAELPWIRDGVDELEIEAVELLYREALCFDLDFAEELATAPWVVDGMDASELQVYGRFRETEGSTLLIPILAQTSWVLDGLTEVEKDALSGLARIFSGGRQDDAAMLSILNMPFLNDSIDAFDVATLSSLYGLHHASDRSYLQQVLSHPALSGGITGSNKSLVAVLDLVLGDDSDSSRVELLDVLLDPTQTTVEERVILLPRAGEATLIVVHTRPGAFRTMDILESTVRAQEEFMLEAFPLKHVVVLAAEVTPNAGGASFGMGRIAIDPGGENNIHLVAHEVAHIYELGNSPWFVEGGAELLRAASVGDPLRIENVKLSLCQQADNLSEIDRLEFEPRPDKEADAFPYVTRDCPYVMGLGLFVDLHTKLGDWAFRQSFRRLHLKARDRAHEDTCVDMERAVCLVGQAFVTDAATPRDAAIAGAIIHRWYYGSIAEFRSRSR